VEGEELGDEDEDKEEEAGQVGEGPAPASASSTPRRVRLRGNNTTIDDIRPLLEGTYVLFLQECSGWYVMVDLETNRMVDDTRAIPLDFCFKGGTLRGTGRVGTYMHFLKKSSRSRPWSRRSIEARLTRRISFCNNEG